MNNPKINILFNFHKGPWGGGNQFLKALKKKFISWGIYEENPNKADVILFNSFPFNEEYRFIQAYNLKKKNKIIIHRVDGPISQIRGKDIEIDKMIYLFNDILANGTIFQSNWSKIQNKKLGMKNKKYETIIINAPDPTIFNKINKIPFEKKRKIRLIATSWASNWLKGFKIYQYLDEKLNFLKYDLTFIGNSPIYFKNIKWIKPIKSHELAKHLKKNDIFITASKNDPCSNSLIEALHCGLPVVVLNDGGHPEIVGKAGELFKDENDVLEKIDKVIQDYNYYKKNITVPLLDEIATKYVNFIKKIYQDYKNKTYSPKISNLFQIYKIYFIFSILKLKNKEFKQILRLLYKNVKKRIRMVIRFKKRYT